MSYTVFIEADDDEKLTDNKESDMPTINLLNLIPHLERSLYQVHEELTVTVRAGQDEMAENVADDLSEIGLLVTVQRHGSGNGRYSGRGGDGVDSLTIRPTAVTAGELGLPLEVENDPRRPGAAATKEVQFGPHGRYTVGAVHSRDMPGLPPATVAWFVWDAEVVDELTGFPSVRRIEDSLPAALGRK